MTKTWERREQLHKLIEAHIYQISKVKGQDLIPEKTGELLGSFSMMSQRQKEKLTAFLMGKKPSEISVRDVLNVTGKICKRGRAVMTEKRQKKIKRDNELDTKIKNIIQWKAYRSITSRIAKGRPKKYNLFKPRKRIAHYEEEVEDVEQMSKVTSNLFLSALNVDGKKAMQKYEVIPQEVKANKFVQEDIALLSKIIVNNSSQTATCSNDGNRTVQNSQTSSNNHSVQNSQTTSNNHSVQNSQTTSNNHSVQNSQTTSNNHSLQNSQTTSNNHSVHETVNKIQHVDVQNGDEQVLATGKNKVTRIIKSSKIVNQNDQNREVSRRNKSGNLVNTNMSTCDRITTNTASESDNPRNSNTALSASSSNAAVEPVNCEMIHDKNSRAVSEISSESSVNGPCLSGSDTKSTIRPESGNLSTTDKTVPVNNVCNSVIKVTNLSSSANQICVNKPTPKQLPFLPPNLTTLRGFEWLLMQRKLLISKAGSYYNGFFYRQQAAEQQMVTGSDRGQYNVDLNSVMKNIDQKVGSVAMKGKRAISKKFNKMEEPKGLRRKGPDATRDPLKNVRKTVDYELLKTRFQSMFTWPALLATTVPTVCDIQDTNMSSMESGMSEENNQQAKNKRYPCGRTKNYYKRVMKGNAWRKEVTKKIQETKRKNRIAKLQGLPVEPSNNQVRKRKPKLIDEKDKRSSARIQERKNVEELMKTVQERDQEVLQKKKRAKNVKRAMMFMLDQEERPVMREPVSNNKLFPVVDDTVIEIVPNISHQIEQPEQVSYPDTVIEIVSETELTDQGQGQSQYFNGNVPIHITSFEPLSNFVGESGKSESTVNLQSQNKDAVISTNNIFTSLTGNGPDVVMATPIGHIDEETGTLKPHTSELAYPVALVVNHTTLDNNS
ncbi:hypothetical protein KUTeg_022239 [Tegillarca granosa]|uniref:Uncharacterized protein n=1 Tax=Tegillarca granosa TaxID=220873 RepID=A0ABQ9EB76_TEGGR|nr:hypothetical protein KUTeg_022239 [Tegillarca granosa]